ncbi:MAG: hypothetical protein ACRD3C_23880 [Vicinamibacterales bacterium]
MGRRVESSVVVIGLTAAVCLGPGVLPSQAQQLRIENVYPRQLPIGQTTVIHAVVATRDDVQGADISPSQGVTIARVARGETFQGALTWFSLTIEVASNAAAGDRALVLQLPAGRTMPTTLTIPPHVPRIADLRILGVRSAPPAIDLEVTATDASADLGAAPHVWFMVACGDMPLPGVVRGTVTRQGESGGLIHASVPRPALGRGTPTSAKCELQVRVADAAGFESSTLTTTLDVTNQPRASP